MVQNQLVDYVSSQVKLGVSRDSIKAALVGVGWAAQDVEDTLKKVEGGSAPSGTGGAPDQTAVSAQQPAAVAKSPESQNIRVSDLVSASLTPTVLSSSNSGGTPQKVSSGTPKAAEEKGSAIPAMSQLSKRMGKSAYVMIGLILILAGVSAYLYFQNSGLSSQVSSLGGQSQGSASQVSSLTNQVQALNSSNTSLTAQITQLSTQIQELQTDLSFFVVQTGQSATMPVAATATGVLSGGKPLYVVTTLEGVKVYVKNSSDADVRAALQPLLGATSTIQISGTHDPGSPNVTVINVNGAPVTPPVTASSTASSTVSSTPAAASSTGQQ